MTDKQAAYYWGFMLYEVINSPWWEAIEKRVLNNIFEGSIKI